jgi:hypothetical protein
MGHYMYNNVEKMVENVENVRGNVYLFKMLLFFEEKNSIRHYCMYTYHKFAKI